MHTKKRNSYFVGKVNPRPLNTTLTTLACLVAGFYSVQAQAATIYGCNVSFYSSDNANGCSASVALNQQLDGSVYGGYSTKGAASNNNVTVAHGAYVMGSVYGGSSEDKETNHNQVVIGNNVIVGKDGTSWDAGGDVRGGSSIESTADFNAVRIGSNVTVRGFVSGGSAGSSNTAVTNNVSADSNSVHIGDASTIIESVYGGSGGKTASFNEVYIGHDVKVGPEVNITNGGIITGGSSSIQADFLSTEANSNVVNIGDNIAVAQIYGGNALSDPYSSNSTAKDNRIIIGNYSNTLFVSGAEGWTNGTVMNNSVTISNDAKASQVYGARSASGNVTNNSVSIGHNLKADRVYGGDAYSAIAGEGNAHNNKVVIGENATVNEFVIGGNALTNANNNSVVLYKGFNVSGVAGGVAQNDTTNNTVTLFAGTVQNSIAGGNSNNYTGNTLNLGSASEGIEMNKLSAKEVLNFDTINFYLPANAQNNDTVLKLSTTYLELGNTTMNAYVSGNANLNSGDVIHLIGSEGKLVWNGQGHVYQGVTLAHDLAGIALDGESKNLDLKFNRSSKQTTATTNTSNPTNTGATANTGSTTNTATNTATATTTNTGTTASTANAATANTVTTATSVNPKTKSLVQGRLVAPALINGSADFLSGSVNSLYQSTNLAQAGANGNGFANAHADNREITTGSYVDLKGIALDAGYAWNKPVGSGNWMYGVAAEYGYSHYTAHLDDGTKGKGKAWNLGANAFTNYLWNNGLYVQGSVRAGRVWSDYRSNDFVHAGGNSVDYDSDSNYVAGHAGVGKIWQLGSSSNLDTYVKYFHSHTSSDKAKLSSGETYDFSSVRSQRGRIGAQYNHNLGSSMSVHFGVAYEREWDGDVRAQYQGNALATPTMKGGTTIGEASMQYKFYGKKINAALQGFGGRQQGVGFRIGMEF